MEARDPPRPPALQMQMQMQAQSAAPPPGSFGAFYHHHLRGGAGAFPSQQQQPPSPQHQQQSGSRNPLIPSTIHTPAALRHPSPSPNPNPNPHPTPNFGSNPNPNPNSSPNPNPSVSACYPPKTPPHMIQHQLHAASSPPSAMGTGTGMSTATAMVLSRSDPVKRKRGRPRKYVTDANGPPLASSPLPLSSASPREKKGGRGSGKKAHLSSLGATGQGFTPHVLTIGAGEDVTAKIMTFSQHGPWAVCILSANGAISNASLWHAGISSGPVTYEGRFEVLSLSGLFLLTESSGMRSRTGGLSVSLAGQDGRVIGGRVAGPLMAATPVQVVVGTFFPESRKSHARAGNMEGTSHMPPVGGGARQLSMPADIEQTHMEASGAMQDHIPGPSAGVDNEEHHVSHVMPLQSADWGGSHFDMEARNHSEQI